METDKNNKKRSESPFKREINKYQTTINITPEQIEKLKKMIGYYGVSMNEIVRRSIDFYFWQYYNKELKGYQGGTGNIKEERAKQKEFNEDIQLELINNLLRNWTPQEAHDYMDERGMFERGLIQLNKKNLENVQAHLWDKEEDGKRWIQYRGWKGDVAHHEIKTYTLETKLNDYISKGELKVIGGEFIFKAKK